MTSLSPARGAIVKILADKPEGLRMFELRKQVLAMGLSTHQALPMLLLAMARGGILDREVDGRSAVYRLAPVPPGSAAAARAPRELPQRPALRDLILQVLEKHPDLMMAEIVERVCAISDYRANGIQGAVLSMHTHGALDRHGPGRLPRYRVGNDERRVVRSKFSIPKQLAGERLNPMAWSMRHLLGAAAC